MKAAKIPKRQWQLLAALAAMGVPFFDFNDARKCYVAIVAAEAAARGRPMRSRAMFRVFYALRDAGYIEHHHRGYQLSEKGRREVAR